MVETYNFGSIAGDEQSDGSFTYPVYGVASQNPYQGALGTLQNVYGTSVPMLEWVKRIQTGTGTYNPESPTDNEMLKKYKDYLKNNPQQQNEMPSVREIVGAVVAPAAEAIGANIGAAYVNQAAGAKDLGAAVKQGFNFNRDITPELTLAETSTTDYWSNPLTLKKGQIWHADLSTPAIAKEAGYSDLFNKMEEAGDLRFDSESKTYFVANSENATYQSRLGGLSKGITRETLTPGQLSSAQSNPSYMDKFTNRLTDKTQWGAAAGGAIANFGVQILMGKDPVKAAKSAGAGMIGRVIGNALLPGIGGWLGGTLGSIIGGRVICNELMRQGLADRKQVVLDYKFTRDHLTPTHVKGYHVWAVWMVKQMRKGRFVKFWGHVAGHRANEIAYIYGERSKPDYLGKVYRKIFEPVCWLVGSFCEKTDWSILYSKKEI